jgi:hypothetical protein
MGNRPQMRAKTMGKAQMITARVPPNVRPEFSRAGVWRWRGTGGVLNRARSAFWAERMTARRDAALLDGGARRLAGSRRAGGCKCPQQHQ